MNTIEKRIGRFFNQKNSHSPLNVEELNNELIHAYRQRETSLDDKECILNFFINSGQNRSAFRLILHDVKNEKYVFWGHLIHLCYASEIKPPEELKESIRKGVFNQNGEQRAAKSTYSSLVNEELGYVRQSIRQKLHEDFQKTKTLLFQKLDFYKNEELYRDEKRLLAEIEFLYPKEHKLKQLKEDFNQRWARELISSKALPQINDPKPLPPSKEEQEFCDYLLQTSKEICSQNPHFSYDFAILFYFMEEHQSALEIIRMGKKDFSSDWFETEILFQLRRYVDCLSYLESLEKKYKDNPETIFATSYFKAQCYWELKQPGLAVQVMKSLLQIKPEYRSADSFMAKWTQGEQVQ
ncbi:MAG: hypothetical protein KDD50_12635 [Bdellovibrionales bacterium]|nr:hypothetical protein [Bdellovibrionales bacterium]